MARNIFLQTGTAMARNVFSIGNVLIPLTYLYLPILKDFQ